MVMLRIRCRRCGWHTLLTSAPDDFIRMPPEVCGECGSREFVWLRPSVLERMAAYVMLWFRRTDRGRSLSR